MGKKYAWQRRWYARYANNAFGSHQANLEPFWLLQTTSQPVYFNEIESIPCLILLGEPGIGKTETLKSEFAKLRANLQSGPDDVDFIDLEGVRTREHLEEIVFDNPKFVAWKNGSYHLTLFLDSVDRALLPVSTVIKTISQKLRYIDLKRLHLRLACRDIDWSISIADELIEIWREANRPKLTEVQYISIPNTYESSINIETQVQERLNPQENEGTQWVQIYQLAPLNVQDIALAAIENSLPPDEFFHKLNRFDALSLATFPITLEFLLYRNIVTDNRVDLFREGCELLCSRRNPDEAEEFTTTLKQRFQMASRIAALVVFTNSYCINLDNSASRADATLIIPDILMISTVDEERLVRDTLSTALFRGTKHDRTFAHRSFAEFLAAYYVTINKVPLSHIVNMSETVSKEFAPQLHETLRWLSEMREDVINAIAHRQPYLLFSMDMSHIASRAFKKFLTELLNLDDQYMYVSLMDDVRAQYARINHPELVHLLPQYLNDRSRSVYLRRFITVMIDRFRIEGLSNELIKIVLDTTEDTVLRRLAAGAIWDTGTIEVKLKLKPFIYGLSDDADDELKGYALLSLWPDHLSAQEVFQVLSHPKQSNFIGSYHLFLSPDRLIKALSVKDLSVALKWVESQPASHELDYIFREILFAIMFKGWDNIQDPQIFEAFAYAALSRLEKHEGIFGATRTFTRIENSFTKNYFKAFIDSSDERHHMAEFLIPTFVKDKTPSYMFDTFFFRDDLDWLLHKLLSCTDTDEKNYWVAAIVSILNQIVGWNYKDFEKDDLPEIIRIFETSEKSDDLAKATAHYFLEWSFNDTWVIKYRNDYYATKHFDEEYRLPPHDPTPLQIIENALDKVEEGKFEGWLRIIFALLLNPEGGQTPFDLQRPHITEFPSWEMCGSATQARIVEAARKYVLQQDTEQAELNGESLDEDWFITGKGIPYWELAGYLALFLLLRQDPIFVAGIPIVRWQRWSHIVVWYPFLSGVSNDRREQDQETIEKQNQLISIIYQQIPELIIPQLLSLIDQENKTSEHIYILYKFERCWDKRMEAALVQKAHDAALTPNSLHGLLEYLLKHGSSRARDFVEETVMGGYKDESQKERVIQSVAAWMRYPIGFKWSVIWNQITRDENFGKKVIEIVSDYWDYHVADFANQMTPNQVADLFIWLEEKYPHQEDPKNLDFHTVGVREEVAHFRNALINYLKDIQTPEAKSNIERISAYFPEYEWLQLVKTEIQRVVIETQWKPPTPSQITKFELKSEKKWTIEKQSLVWGAIGSVFTVIGVIVAIILFIISGESEQNQWKNTPIADPSPSLNINILGTQETDSVGTLEVTKTPQITEQLPEVTSSP